MFFLALFVSLEGTGEKEFERKKKKKGVSKRNR